MPRRVLVRAVISLALASSVFLTAMPGPASALEPPRPLPGYRPAFITEVDTGGGAWQDCLWASSAMLLDKWTNGQVVVDRERLRRLSGDRRGGSTFADVRTAFAKLDIPFRYSPDGGDRMSWAGLLDRLADGAGAVVLGDYGNLPRRFARWDPRFWKKPGEDDNHAMYLDGYERRTGRVFLMDPLAPAGWTGEWISAKVLRRFVWKRGGAVFAATTPTAAPAPFAGVRLGSPTVAADAATIRIGWKIDAAPKGWRFPGVDLSTTVDPVVDRVPSPTDQVVVVEPAVVAAGPARRSPEETADAQSTGVQSTPATTTPTPAVRPSVNLVNGVVVASTPSPTSPGVYRLTTTLRERRFGQVVATSGERILYVPGDRWARYGAPASLPGEGGQPLPLSVVVMNRGVVSWTARPAYPGFPLTAIPDPNARLVATWLPTDGGAAPEPVDLGPVALAAGGNLRIDASVIAPKTPGRWTLVLDVIDDVVGSYAARGSAPALVTVDIAAPPDETAPR